MENSLNTIVVGEGKLSLDNFYNVCLKNYQVSIDDASKMRIKQARESVKKIIDSDQVVYGINTGFGSLSNTNISKEDLEKLQRNLILSHAIGCGKVAPNSVVRGMLLLRLVCICIGHSGVRLKVANKLIEALNKNYIPMVPRLGTVGASGDLAPLSHLMMGMIGEGLALDSETNKYINAKEVMAKLGIKPLVLKAKEGLALNNGTQFITSYTAQATHHAIRLSKLANLVAALSVEALHGVDKAFDEKIQLVKPHAGQIHTAKQMRHYLCPYGIPSDINKAHTKDKVQDAYSLRCIPQIHGAAFDLITFCENIVVTEMNSANDNPLIFGSEVISGGNFHGMYIGMAADNIALAMSYLCNISERRLERLLNPALNKFLPSFLVKDAGLNSGLMIVQYASAGITAENRQLAMPSSVHNIPTCQGTEDVVSMAGHSSRKAMDSVENTYRVLAYELLAAYQAMHFTTEHPHHHLHHLLEHMKQNLPKIENDMYMKNHLDWIIDFLKNMDISQYDK